MESLSADVDVEVFHTGLFTEQEQDSAYDSLSSTLATQAELNGLLESLLAGQYMPSGSYFQSVQRLCCEVLVNKPPAGTLVHAHDWHSVFAAIAVKRRYGLPFVLQLHSTVIEREGAQARGLVYAIEQWGVDEAEKVICVSSQSAACVFQHYELDRAKMYVVHNASHFSSPLPCVSGRVQNLLFVGRMCSQKSPELMLGIFRRLLVSYPNLKLLMAGEGEHLTAVRQIVDFYQIEQSVEILGKVSHDNMRLVFERADVLCLPSIAEPFGIVALEAAQNGLSVLMSDRCGARELLPSAVVLRHRDTDGWLAALERLIAEPGFQRSLATSVQKEAASRTWRDAAAEVLAIYASMGA